MVHALDEEPDELIERTFRYGVGNAKIVSAHHRWQESSPYADDWLLSILKVGWHDYRRFPEFPCGEVQRLFTAFNIIEASAWLVGYLDQSQRELGLEVFTIDCTRLESELCRFIQSLLAAISLTDLEAAWLMSLPRIASPGPHPSDDYPQIAALLRRSITPNQDESAARALQAHLSMYRGQVEQEQ